MAASKYAILMLYRMRPPPWKILRYPSAVEMVATSTRPEQP
jgi:hypothetical protein